MKQYSDTELLALAEENQQKARRLVAATRIVELWREAGAEVNLVGSLRTGLLMTHRDVDFHVYTPHPSPLDGIGVMARLAVLRLKFETPETVSIPGIEYCRAVLDGGVRDYGSFEEYRRRNTGSLLEWMPGK